MTHDEGAIGRRTRRYWVEDGLVELGASVLFAGVGLIFAVAGGRSEAGPAASVDNALPTLLVLGIVVAAPLAMRALIGATKERLTYPRTGYVAYRRTSTRNALLAALLALVIVAGAAAAGASGSANVVLAWQSLTLAAVLLVPGVRLRLRRFYVLAGVAMILGGAAAFLAVGALDRAAILYGGIGIALLVSGAWTLRTYLGQPPVAGAREG